MSDCLLVAQTVGSCIHNDMSDIEHFTRQEDIHVFLSNYIHLYDCLLLEIGC